MTLTRIPVFGRLEEWKRRAVGYLLFVAAALVATALGYRWGMATYEGRPQTFIDALQFAVEMFTTTGFGGDSPWESPQMNLFITVTDLLGMILLVGALPVFVGPFVESVLSSAVPRTPETPLEDHVVICSDTTRTRTFTDELGSRGIPYVFVEPDGKRATELYEDGRNVIRADPTTTADLDAADLPAARALFADVSDRVDASIVLAAKELAPEVPVVSVVEDPDAVTYHRLAGADHVLTPRSVLGEALAAKATAAARTGLDETVAVGDEVRLAEVSLRQGSRLAGSRLADSDIREETGVTVVGLWAGGEFRPAPTADSRLPMGSVLLVAGRPDQLERLTELARSSVRGFQTGETIVVGYGQVGRTAAAELEDAGVPYTVVDRDDAAGVDVVGDASDPETLEAAGIRDAETVILALPDDTTTEFTTLVVRDVAPEAQTLARVQEQSNVSKTYHAGADYVLSLSDVTGRMSASRLLDDETAPASTQLVEVARTEARALAGRTIVDAAVGERTECTVIAIERDGATIADITPDTTIEAGDELVVVGTDEGIDAFERTFG